MGGGTSKSSTDRKPLGQAGLKAPSTLAIAATAPPRNFNEEFQRALDLLDAEDYVQGYAMLASACTDFQAKAMAANEVIISELGIVDEEKTYLSSTHYSGGPGFTMYEAGHIIFKVSHGGQGSREWLELGNEFRATTQLLHCRLHSHDKCAGNIALPLMLLIDFKGFRSLCWARLPRREKLVIGWDPVLKGFVSDQPEVQVAVQRAGEMLGLAFHTLGSGSLAVRTNLHADVNCWMEEGSSMSVRRKRCYVTNLKHLYPTDLSRGATIALDAEELPPEVHCETPEKLRPEMVRRYATLSKAGGLSADTGLAPPRANPVVKYVHDGADESLEDLKRAVLSLTRLQTLEAIDAVAKVLKEVGEQEQEAAQEAAQQEKALAKRGSASSQRAHLPPPTRMQDHEKMALVATTLRAEGINMRFLGHVRSKIKTNSHDKGHAETRRLLLHEMVARVLKTSIYKILREANGFKGEQGSIVDAVKTQLGMNWDARDKEVKSSDKIPWLEEVRKTKRARP